MSPFELVTVPGKNALAELERLRARYPATGLYPILFGDAEDYQLISEGMEDASDASLVLEQSRRIDPLQWLREKLPIEPDEDGEWPEEAGDEMGIRTHLDILSREPKKETVIGLLKVAAPWEVFAYLNWGGWNDCPFPAEHCAPHRYWASQYGAEVVSITGDVVQCTVSRPPTDRESSLRLAREQFCYCYDIVEQGTETIAALAAGLMNSNCWYFWWD